MFSAGPLTVPIMYLDRGGIAGLIGNREGPRYLIYYLLHGGSSYSSSVDGQCLRPAHVLHNGAGGRGLGIENGLSHVGNG